MDNKRKKALVVGLLAHVDAGKTTLSEALLYQGGRLRRLGRVDHGDAFLDTHDLERERGITIFSHQALLPLEDCELTLLDTPGHVDFSAEMERVLPVLDCAVLVISGADGVQAHTRTLWRLLQEYRVPVFLFVNKMDQPDTDRAALLKALKHSLDEGCVDFNDPTAPRDTLLENAALCDETLLERFLEEGSLSDGDLAGLVAQRKLFPCFFGSALKLSGVDALLDGLARYLPQPQWPEEFGARVFKISRDPQGARLTWLRVTGGTLKVKALLDNGEKADQLRLYSGEKYQTADQLPAGTVCAVTGLSATWPGQGLGREAAAGPPLLEPVLNYRLNLPAGVDPHAAYDKLSQLQEEDPQLHLVWSGPELHVQLMGEVQLEILRRLIVQRFGWEVSFGAGRIVYRETVAAPALGVGHFEPLRHYAEVQLLIEPGPRGSGVRLTSACPTDQLDLNWQRLILTHLGERSHPGVLVGGALTDVKITLLTGRAHVKHTEGGDFRQATYRAVRQGLMGAENILLEPWYSFRLEVPAAQVGRALTDLDRMGGRVESQEPLGELTLLTGGGPVAGLRGYAAEVAAYTRGLGRLSCTLRGYEPCPEQDAVVNAAGYDPERDVDNPPDSVFCAHGGGFVVPWYQVPSYAHVSLNLRQEEEEPAPQPVRRQVSYSAGLAQDKELQEIFERTYGAIQKPRAFQSAPKPKPAEPAQKRTIPPPSGPDYLLVDGYNIIFAWDELKAVASTDLDAARQQLMELLSNYQGFQKCEVILVFDAYKVPGGTGSVQRYHNIFVVYTKEAETADTYIERTTYELGRHHRVRVATSDYAEQMIILGHGALRLSARIFKQEVEQVTGQITSILARNNRREDSRPVQAAMERAKKRT